MAKRRIVPARIVAVHEANLRKAVRQALRRQLTDVERRMAAAGHPLHLTAAAPQRYRTGGGLLTGTPTVPWTPTAWTTAVTATVKPAATAAGHDLIAAAALALGALAWGWATSGTPAGQITSSAQAAGAWIGTRVNEAAAAAATPAQAVSDVLSTATAILGDRAGYGVLAQANALTVDALAYSMRYAGESGTVVTWNAVGDDRTRPDHMDATGQEVAPGEPFTVGGELLMYPGDPNGSDEQTINCRCWLTSTGPVTATEAFTTASEPQTPEDTGDEEEGDTGPTGEQPITG